MTNESSENDVSRFFLRFSELKFVRLNTFPIFVDRKPKPPSKQASSGPS